MRYDVSFTVCTNSIMHLTKSNVCFPLRQETSALMTGLESESMERSLICVVRIRALSEANEQMELCTGFIVL